MKHSNPVPSLLAVTAVLIVTLACSTPPGNRQERDRRQGASDAEPDPEKLNAEIDPGSPARLRARPRSDTKLILRPGRHLVGPGRSHAAVLVVPDGTREPLPLLLMLHGAGGDASSAAAHFRDLPQQYGFALLAVKSEGPTWDGVMSGSFGADVHRIDAALQAAFADVPVDPDRVAIMGLSDGGTYSLSLGRANGDLFNAMIALSPGFLVDATTVGRPRAFVTHGTQDRVLPIDATSRRIVPLLEDEAYEVTYIEFDGGHHFPYDNTERAVAWWLGDGD